MSNRKIRRVLLRDGPSIRFDETTTSLTQRGVDQLAQYNAEVGRGIMHTLEWQARMAELQERFDEERRRYVE